jgi:rubrerythrin
MPKLGISRDSLHARIKDEQQAQRDYGKHVSEAKSNNAPKTAKVIKHIQKEEGEHEKMLKSLDKGNMKSNPSSKVLQQSQTEVNVGSKGSAERNLNQGHDTGMRPHAQEALKASLETGLGDETFRSKGGDKSTYSPDSSTGHVSRY